MYQVLLIYLERIGSSGQDTKKTTNIRMDSKSTFQHVYCIQIVDQKG